ncbi:helix-turn-helix domain-containing protein [Desulforamulus ruminis]|uniref:Helix-turn-helix domain protein n=1 Tax=Desulforamulus ruminis (strain ATCC 23193 / DSM 2154 / NCIMB 8452 / DL) TaxID=696281 RepID=F6DTY2_DESRL|nr:helix-turn-helix transcriptional regulator [Desulforamulus ruminis]AEG59000.1 helix-turn-helix domain protein [Desulforamulus ruminis DSM 2154]
MDIDSSLTTLKKDIGSRLTKFREAKNYSRNRLANESGVTQGFISLIELGKRLPKLEVLSKICSVLGITFEEFFSNKGKEELPINNNFNQLNSLAQKLTSDQLQLINSVMKEIVRVNKTTLWTNKTDIIELLDLLERKYATLTVAGRPITLEERVQLLKALNTTILPPEDEDGSR